MLDSHSLLALLLASSVTNAFPLVKRDDTTCKNYGCAKLALSSAAASAVTGPARGGNSPGQPSLYDLMISQSVNAHYQDCKWDNGNTNYTKPLHGAWAEKVEVYSDRVKLLVKDIDVANFDPSLRYESGKGPVADKPDQVKVEQSWKSKNGEQLVYIVYSKEQQNDLAKASGKFVCDYSPMNPKPQQ